MNLKTCIAVVLGLAGCVEAKGKEPAPPVDPTFVKIDAAGDTAKGYFSWKPGRGATDYLVTVTATNTAGLWTGLPVNVSTQVGHGSFIATNAVADSADFTVCIKSFNSAGAGAVSAPTCSAPRRWRRPPSPPPSVVWDSLQVANLQGTAGWCAHWRLPDSLQWRVVTLDALTCPRTAWTPPRDVVLSVTGRTCDVTGHIPPIPIVRVGIVDPDTSHPMQWLVPPLLGNLYCGWTRE